MAIIYINKVPLYSIKKFSFIKKVLTQISDASPLSHERVHTHKC